MYSFERDLLMICNMEEREIVWNFDSNGNENIKDDFLILLKKIKFPKKLL